MKSPQMSRCVRGLERRPGDRIGKYARVRQRVLWLAIRANLKKDVLLNELGKCVGASHSSFLQLRIGRARTNQCLNIE